MILALLREIEKPGTGKTMTRRLLYTPTKNLGSAKALEHHPWPSIELPVGKCWTLSGWEKVEPGDRLWVRENLDRAVGGAWFYKADGRFIQLPADDPRVASMIAWAHHKELKYAPSIHMPRWASRITLLVKAKRIERLHEITEADATAEGAQLLYGDPADPTNAPTNRRRFELLWRELNGDEAWDSNPEVVVTTFDVVGENVEKLAEAA